MTLALVALLLLVRYKREERRRVVYDFLKAQNTNYYMSKIIGLQKYYTDSLFKWLFDPRADIKDKLMIDRHSKDNEGNDQSVGFLNQNSGSTWKKLTDAKLLIDEQFTRFTRWQIVVHLVRTSHLIYVVLVIILLTYILNGFIQDHLLRMLKVFEYFVTFQIYQAENNTIIKLYDYDLYADTENTYEHTLSFLTGRLDVLSSLYMIIQEFVNNYDWVFANSYSLGYSFMIESMENNLSAINIDYLSIFLNDFDYKRTQGQKLYQRVFAPQLDFLANFETYLDSISQVMSNSLRNCIKINSNIIDYLVKFIPLKESNSEDFYRFYNFLDDINFKLFAIIFYMIKVLVSLIQSDVMVFLKVCSSLILLVVGANLLLVVRLFVDKLVRRVWIYPKEIRIENNSLNLISSEVIVANRTLWTEITEMDFLVYHY